MTRRRFATLLAVCSFLALPRTARADGNVIVRSNGDCPSGQAVLEALWAIRPAGEWPLLTATVEVVAEGVEVALGDSTHRRTIPLPTDCSERANRVALVIAVWSGEISSETVPPLLAAPAPMPEPALAVSAKTPAPAPIPKPAMVTEVGVSGFYAGVGGWVPGARIELGALQRKGVWGLRASLAHQSARSLRVDIGDSQYARTSVTAALVLQWNRPRIFLSSDWGIVGAFTSAHGDGYSENQSSYAQNLGIAIDGRFGLRIKDIRIWAGIALCRWALKESIRVDRLSVGLGSTATLPAWDAQLGLGTSLLFD